MWKKADGQYFSEAVPWKRVFAALVERVSGRNEGPGARGQEGRRAEGPSEGEERRDARRTGGSQELMVWV